MCLFIQCNGDCGYERKSGHTTRLIYVKENDVKVSKFLSTRVGWLVKGCHRGGY
jgi:hypothetical protein